jgi:hypothetical protein
VEGEIRHSTSEDEDGAKRFWTEIVVSRLIFLRPRRESGDS